MLDSYKVSRNINLQKKVIFFQLVLEAKRHYRFILMKEHNFFLVNSREILFL
jgi:hypothetical protein